MDQYKKSATCHLSDLFGAYTSYQLRYNLKDSPLNFVSSIFRRYKPQSTNNGAILSVPIPTLCLQNRGKIRLLVKALGKRTQLRYLDCKDENMYSRYHAYYKKRFKTNVKTVITPFNVDWRPATRRQAIYAPYCCDVCWIFDYLRPCAFACPDVYSFCSKMVHFSSAKIINFIEKMSILAPLLVF